MKKYKITIGMKIGYLTIISQPFDVVNKQGNKTKKITCKCNCGIIKDFNFYYIMQQKYPNITCSRNCSIKQKISKVKDIEINTKYGKLTIISKPFFKKIGKIRRTFITCQCECGNRIDVRANSIKTGNTRSCGCGWYAVVKNCSDSNGETKICGRCKKVLSVKKFKKDKRMDDNLYSTCKDCINFDKKIITREEYNQLLEQQNRVCACCGTSNPGKNKKYFAIDHCHKSGVIRGLLCSRCNPAIGLLHDSDDGLYQAYKYLKRANELPPLNDIINYQI
jgi:hypothetical protein